MSNIFVRKLKLTIINEDEEKRKEQYKFIRDSQYAQYQGLNLAMSVLTSAYLQSNRDTKSNIFKEAKKRLNNSNSIFEGINFGKGIDSKSSITQKVKQDFSIALKNGLARGERSIANYKRTYPLMTRGRDLKFNYNENNEIIIKWVNKIIFKVVIGRKDKSHEELMHTLHKIIAKEYSVKQSSLYFDKNNKLILNLTIESLYKENNKDVIEGRTLGVDLGIKYPAYICLNDNTSIREHIGESMELLKQREQFRNRRKRLQQQLRNVKGGKGRNKKLSALNKLSDSERNFAKTYNHTISKRIVDFAKKHNCEYINLEDLNKNGFDDNILSNWSYYELQTMIEYKSEKVGIKIRYIDPKYTSQKCSVCGNIDKENRPTQEQFKCNKCGFELNADYNAAINIARSFK
ncbi:RNA-guided endonuclease InsQ/TnpB family protein [Peptacetobacter sp.]|uniref:RNA-guided endonuclease InsQ/TnpB family protein n=1 Tax=Peptacetobacter sp. TaxID=2991975 RepID=UPI00260598F0|nr:transposase [Peptacetobacter sp.]